ncbi:MAG: ComF family protein [Clostridia bacterium]|nr:ComF family protein [Clostridia bacterium]
MKPDWKGLLFPRAAGCLCCGDPRRAEDKYCLCPECRERLLALRLRENLCPRCMGPLDGKGRCHFCMAERLRPLRAGYGAFRYAGEAKALVERLKYGYEDEAADALAAVMAQCFPASEYDALVPVPLYRTRQRGRGANQAALLCDRVGPKAGLPVLDALRRVRNTRTQVHLSPAERQKNVHGAFAATMEVQGLRLLLVDDVRTTGATTRACGEALLTAGAKYVGVLSATIATH